MTDKEKIKQLEARVEELEKKRDELVDALLMAIMNQTKVERIEINPIDPIPRNPIYPWRNPNNPFWEPPVTWGTTFTDFTMPEGWRIYYHKWID